MGNKIMSTKDSAKGYLTSMIISALFDVVMFVILLKLADYARTIWRFSMAKSITGIAWIVLVASLLMLLSMAMLYATYVNIYQDGIDGKGRRGMSNDSFYLRWDQVTNISCSRGRWGLESGGTSMILLVSTLSGDYKIVASVNAAEEVVRHYREVVRVNAPTK